MDFQDGSHLGFPIKTIFAILIYKSPHSFLSSFQSIGPSVQEKSKTDFQDQGHGDHLGFPIGKTLTIFDLQDAQIPPTKFESTGLSVQEKQCKTRFLWWWPWLPSWISNQNYFSNFLFYKLPWYFLQTSSQLAFRFRRRSTKQISKMVAILDFRLELL